MGGLLRNVNDNSIGISELEKSEFKLTVELPNQVRLG